MSPSSTFPPKPLSSSLWTSWAAICFLWACSGVSTHSATATHSSGRPTGVGLWMDDGNGRTVLADRLDAHESFDLAQDMLDLLDLPAPPAMVGGSGRRRHHHAAHKDHGSAPTWMKSVYNNLDEHGHANGPNMDDTHRATVTAADTIITFVSRDPPRGRPSHGANKRLYFDVNDVPLDHSLLGAEIQVHRRTGFEEPIVLHVYMITDEQGSESKVGRVTLSDPGWVTVNVTTPVLSWLIFPDTNFGLRLAVTSPGFKHERHFHEVGLSGSHDEEESRPFMVGFFALPANAQRKKRVRTARSIARPAVSKPRRYRDVADRQLTSETDCRMKHLHVSFSDLKWQDWVIAPEGYDANYCEGHCTFPLHAEMNATNHALVQTLVKILDAIPDEHEPPPYACCAPINLATIPVLYYSFDNNIVLKKYAQMIVKTCGCL